MFKPLKHTFAVLIFLSATLLSASVPVRATLLDPSNNPVKIAFVRFELVRCGYNVPSVPGLPGSMVLKRIDIRPNPTTGLASGSIFGHDELSCGGSYSSLWHVTAYSDSVSPIAGDQDYLICTTATNGCAQSSGTWDLASAQPFTGTLPPPGFQAIFANPVSDQTIVQPSGTALKIVGTFDLSAATVIGFAGGSGGSGGSSITINNGGTTSVVNFNDSVPAAIANSSNVKWQKDTNSPNNVSAYIQWAVAGSSTPGLVALAGDLAGGSAASPQVVHTNLAVPLPPTQGGTGQATLNAAFNAMAPAPAAAQYIMVSSGLSSWGVLAPNVGCLQIPNAGAALQYLPCSTGTITGNGTAGKIPLFTGAGITLGNSDLTQITSTSISTGDALILQSGTPATSLANSPSPTMNLVGNYWTGSASATDTFSFQDVLGSGSNPTSTLLLSHSGSTGVNGLSLGGLGLGVGVGTVPGACGSLAMAKGVCGAGDVTQFDLESTATDSFSGTQISNLQAFQDILLANASGKNYYGGRFVSLIDPANTKDFNGAFGSGPKGLVVGLTLAGSGNITSNGVGRGLDIAVSIASGSAANWTDMTSLYLSDGFQGSGTVGSHRYIWFQGTGQSSGHVVNDYDAFFDSPTAVGSSIVLDNHYAIYIKDQTVHNGTSVNTNPFAIFEVNPNEKNVLGSIDFQGLLRSLSANVDFSGSAHTLIARSGTVLNLPTTCTFTAGAAMEVYLATNAAAGQNWYFCTATNTWTQQLNSGTGSMATDASNASAVAVPNGVNWNPASAGGANLGSAAKPWGTLVIGTGSGTATLSGTFTGNRTITLPDASINVAGTNIANTFTQANVFAAITASSVTSATTNSATGAFLNLANTDTIIVRNGLNNGNFQVLSFDSSNNIYLGSSAVSVRINGALNTTTSGEPLLIQPTVATGSNLGGGLVLAGGDCATTALCGDVVIRAGQGGSGGTAVVQVNSPLTFPLTNSGSNPAQLNKLVSYNSLGLAVITPAGSNSSLAGVCAENCTTTGIAQIAKLGTISLNLDNTGTPGHYVGISPTTNGFGTDCGTSPCTTQVVGVVRSAVSGTLYNVDVLIGSIGGGGSSANAIVTNPSTNQVIQGTSPTTVSLTVDCPVGAAGSLACFRVRDNTGATIFEVHQDASQQSGSGTGGIMTLTAVQSPSTPHASIGFIRVGDTDILGAFRNHANNNDVTISKDINDVVQLANASLFLINPGRESLQETTAPTGTAGQDMFYGDSTFHSIMDLDNNGTIRRLGHTYIARTVSGTTDTITAAQQESWTVYTNAGAIAAAINQSTGQIGNHFCFRAQATGAGAVTFTPATSTINGGATFVVGAGKMADICADGGGNYIAGLLPSTAGSGDMLLGSPNVMTGSGTLNGAAMSTTAGLILPTGAGAVPTSAGVESYDSTVKRVVFGDGTITIGLGKRQPNVQSGTTYTMLSADCSRDTVFTSASSVAVTVPQASTSFPNGCEMKVKVDGAGTVTFTPTTSTIDGTTSVSATTGQGLTIVSDATNYRTFDRGTATGLQDPGGNGVLVRTSLNATANRTLTGTSNQINVTNGDGTGGNPTFAIDVTQILNLTNALTVSNKVFNNTTTLTILDTLFTMQDNGDTTKQIVFQVSGITTATTRTVTFPDRNITIAGVTGTLTSGNLASFDASGNLIDSLIVVANSVTQTANGTANSTVCTYTGANKVCVPGQVTAAMSATVMTRRTCDIAVGDTSGSVLTNSQLGPQKRICFIPAAATIVEVDVAADAGTPNIILGRNRAGVQVNIVSSALATAASGGIACSNTGGTTGIDGATTCSGTLQNTGLNAGDYVEAVSGTAGGTAKFFTAHVTYTIN